MREKLLQANTIIPPHLYVERGADRHLNQIIEQMGRPGYVLVARQMGKTNLLINMKRRRVDDVVIYLDLSNRFDTPLSWFRNVIDSIIATYPDDFERLSDEIAAQRQRPGVEASAEYDRHIRLLLRSTKKKIIVILDEIDSLVNTTFSDVILAQVRSMYFSRVNYPEYNNLTYVLSGVAEPADLIKDKNISPFNIGEKIFLDDFSRDEFDSFLSKAELRFASEVADRIYSWTNGNPRTTWDVCSAIEDRIIAGSDVSNDEVDEIVREMYLESFDRAPIDHIRTLAESDGLIREAIHSIHAGNLGALNDKMKSRLYLAGITKLEKGGGVSLKNRIIENAVSREWLKQISRSNQSLLELAHESLALQSYSLAIEQFEKALSDEKVPLAEEIIGRIHLAIAYINTASYASAIKNLEICMAKTDEPALQEMAKYYMALALLLDENYHRSLEVFDELAVATSPGWRRNALIGKASALVRLEQPEALVEALAVCDRLIGELVGEGAASNQDSSDQLAAAYFNRAKICRLLGDSREAQAALDSALAGARPEVQPKILLAKCKDAGSKEMRDYLIRRAACVIIENEIVVKADIESDFGIFTGKSTIAAILCDLAGLGEPSADLFDRLLDHISKAEKYRGLLKLDVVGDLLSALPTEVANSSYIFILERVAARAFFGAEAEKCVPFLRHLAAYSASPKSAEWTSEYFRWIWRDGFEISDEDVRALPFVAANLKRAGAAPELRMLFKEWRNHESVAIKNQPFASAFLKYQEMLFFSEAGANGAAKEIAKQLIPILSAAKLDAAARDAENREAMSKIRSHAATIIRASSDPMAFLSQYDRNDVVTVRYGKDQPVRKKFKLVVDDLKAGKCRLVSE